MIDLLPARLALLATVFAGVALLALGIATMIGGRWTVRKRIAAGGASDPRIAVGSLRGGRSEGAWNRLLRFVEARGLSLSDSNETEIARKLAAAGFTRSWAPRAFTLIRLLLTLALPATVLSALYLSGRSMGLLSLYLGGSVAGLAGLYLPNLYVSARADRRRERLVNGFPDALDLLLVCVEAGLSLDMAFDRVGREMLASRPLVAQMFGELVTQLRAGRSREEALERLGERSGVDEIRSFAVLLIQSSQLGSSVAQALRTYAAEMRERRRLRAEEKAHRIPVLISMPLVGCLLPAMIGVLMLPAVIRVVRTLLPAMTGG